MMVADEIRGHIKTYLKSMNCSVIDYIPDCLVLYILRK